MEQQKNSSSLWGCGGRFSGGMACSLTQLNNSLSIDKRLFAEDIRGSLAYAEVLCDAKIIQFVELELIRDAFKIIRREWESGEILLKDDDEDVHSVNERRLTEIIGDVGRKIHTGRSRNDQVALDMKLWMKTAITELLGVMKIFLKTVIEKSENNIHILMPGYTHLQVRERISSNCIITN
jgi:argininosuccinate lyase